MASSDPQMGYVVLTKFERKLKEGSGKIGDDGKIAKAEWEHQPVVVNAAHMVALEKVTLVNKTDMTSMQEATCIKMFGMPDILVLESVATILELIRDAGFVVRDARDLVSADA